MEEGEDVNELKLPIQITPDYICGCNQQERIANFNKVIKEYSDQKNEVNKEMTHYSEKMQSTLSKKDFIKRVFQ